MRTILINPSDQTILEKEFDGSTQGMCELLGADKLYFFYLTNLSILVTERDWADEKGRKGFSVMGGWNCTPTIYSPAAVLHLPIDTKRVFFKKHWKGTKRKASGISKVVYWNDELISDEEASMEMEGGL